MNWHKFIFSNESRYRWLRHGIFWLAWWWFFFSITYWLKSPHNSSGLWETKPWQFSTADLHISLWMLIIHICTCYFVISILLPRYLLSGKYLKFFLSIAALGFVMAHASHFVYEKIFPTGENLFIPFSNKANNTWWASVSAGPLSALKVIAATVTIKLLKRWWVKLKENRRLDRERINAELQLLKAQIHPGFLFHTLNNIYAYALAGSPRASEMLLKLSDLLSYMLYECDEQLVPLDKEIQMMKQYMLLEKVRMNENFEMEIQMKGEPKNKFIAPFLLLPFIENSFKYCNISTEKSWLTLDIRIEGDELFIKLINGITPDAVATTNLHENGLANVQKRLDLLYPNLYDLKMNAETEMLFVFLRIRLKGEPERNPQAEEETHLMYSETF